MPPDPSIFLSPYRVLDLCDQHGLLAGRLLAQLGADVIQVEPPGGSPARQLGPFADDAPLGENSLYWSAYAAGKRGVTCDVATEAGRELLLRLAAQVDFLFDSASPGAMAALGLDWETLRAVNPRLIHVSITPFGSDGPKAGWAATELTVWASGGPLLPAREGDRAPVRLSVPQAWLHAAADAAGGALVAHFARLASGVGQHVDISAQQSAAQATLSILLAAPLGHADFSLLSEPKSTKKPKIDLSGSGAQTRRSKWRVRDGLVEMHLGMGPASGRFTNNLFAWMVEEGACEGEVAAWDWVTLPKRIEAGELGDEDLEHARGMVARFLADRDKQSLLEAAIRRKLLLAPIATTADLVDSPHFTSRGVFHTVEESSGRTRTLPGHFVATGTPQKAPSRPAPRPGEHNADVYGGLLGLDEAAREALARQGVI